MRASELRLLSTEELRNRVNDLREEVGRLRFRAGSEEIKNTAHIGSSRREVARILTVLGELERG